MADNALKQKLPSFIGEEPQISSLLDVIQQETGTLETALADKVKGFYIESLSSQDALAAWEKDFAIQNTYASGEERKLEIVSRLNMSGTVTKEALKAAIPSSHLHIGACCFFLFIRFCSNPIRRH